jgi:hypothetical protein
MGSQNIIIKIGDICMEFPATTSGDVIAKAIESAGKIQLPKDRKELEQ